MTLPEKFAHLQIPLEDILSATNNFAIENIIGGGGFGKIYKGKLSRSGKSIDIVARRFYVNYYTYGMGMKEFWMEILMLSCLKNQNLVCNVGFCVDNGENIIINNYEANGSLDKYLNDLNFTWTRRLHVCVGVARALSYIYYDKQRNISVIHRNLKSSKILLDDKWEAKLSGFELSKINPAARRNGLVLDNDISGTGAYLDPAYVKNGGVTHKSDVYSLGVILFEVLCGMKAYIPYKYEIFKNEGDSSNLTKQHSNEGNLNQVVGNEESLTELANPHSNEGKVDVVEKLDEIFKNEGHSTHLTKQHSNQGKLDVVSKRDDIFENEWYSSNVLKTLFNERSLDIHYSAGNPDEFVDPDQNIHMGPANQGKLDVVAKLDDVFKNEGYEPDLAKPHSNEGKVDAMSEHDKIFENQFPSFSIALPVSYIENLIEQAESPISVSDIRRYNESSPHIESPISYSDFPKYSEMSHHIDRHDVLPLSHEISFEDKKLANQRWTQHMRSMKSLKFLQIPKEELLAQLAKSHYEAGKMDDIIDPGLRIQMDSQSLKIFSETAYCCLKEQRAQRPNIDRIIVALEKALELQLKRENTERSTVAAAGTSTSQLKGKDLEHLKIGLDAIKLATENFAEKYYIGAGGYGTVYKAELEHFDSSATKDKKESELPKTRSTVAIKYIFNREDTQGEQGFISEIETLTSCKHPNIISLLGFCYEQPHMILVYEHASNGSLDDYLGSEGKMTNLTWVQRIKICIDTARGLDYIHTTCLDKEKIIHRDIKSANILLDENWEAKIADFGLSKFHPANHKASTLNTLNVVGTKVYWDPEYERTGKLKKESDIYSFGVVLFEILFGRLAYDNLYTMENEKGLGPIARQHFEKGTIKEMIDSKLRDESDENTFTLNKGPNQDSLDTFSRIAYKCLAETQAQRPTMKVVIRELQKALDFQKARKDSFRISFEDVKLATQDFSPTNLIGNGGFGGVYRGEVVHGNVRTPIAVKRMDSRFGQGEREFLTELELLFEYKHDNIIGLVGYCDQEKEKIIVYEYASNFSLDRHLKDSSLTWMTRLKIAIDVAVGLDFLHGGVVTQDAVIHRDIKSANILLTADWKAKIADFGLSIITPITTDIDFVVDNACGTSGYVDPLYAQSGFLTKESDIYSLGVVLFEMMCGRTVHDGHVDRRNNLGPLAKCRYEEGKLDEMLFNGIKEQIVPKSLTTFQAIAYQCLHDTREGRPTAKEVVVQLKKALGFQEEYEIWEPKLPSDYKEIIQMSKTPEIYSNKNKKDLYAMLTKGVLLHEGKVWFSLSSEGKRNEMISAKKFSYENQALVKWKSVHKSRFPKVAKMMDTSNLNIQIQIKTQFLSPGVIYGVQLVFKFCNPRTCSSKPMYVNLRYKMRCETLHTYFATPRDDNWMMIELSRFSKHKENTDFEVSIESFSTYCRGSGAIFVEAIEFKAIDNVENKTLKHVQSVLESNINLDDAQQYLPTDYEQIIKRSEHSVHNKSKNELTLLLFNGILVDEGEKLFSLSKVNGKECYMLPAKTVLHDSSNLTLYTSTHSDHSRFQDVIELLSRQVFRLKCKIEHQLLSSNTKYTCYLVFKLSEKCRGLHCPVKIRDLLHGKNKEFKILYFRPPSPLNSHDAIWVPKQRVDGWMEVYVWEFNTDSEPKRSHVPMDLKFISYEGTMSGLIVNGLEFRPT